MKQRTEGHEAATQTRLQGKDDTTNWSGRANQPWPLHLRTSFAKH